MKDDDTQLWPEQTRDGDVAYGSQLPSGFWEPVDKIWIDACTPAILKIAAEEIHKPMGL